MSSTPRAPRWSRRLAWTAVALLPAGPLLARVGLVPGPLAFLLSALGVLLALLTLLVTLVMLLLPKLRAQRSAIGLNAALAAIPVAVGAFMIVPTLGRPVIHDIATDLADPPQFVAAPALRGADANPLERSPEVDAAQLVGYPQLAAIRTPLAPAAALERAAQIARTLGWEIHAEVPGRGVLEASDTTLWFGFTDDVVVRVRADGDGSRIDLRSVSRVGKGDLGANARRIERFRAAFEANAALAR